MDAVFEEIANGVQQFAQTIQGWTINALSLTGSLEGVFDSRQLAIIIWLAVLFLWGLSKKNIRSSARDVVRVALSKWMLIVWFFSAAFLVSVVLILKHFLLWDITMLFDSVLCYFVILVKPLFVILERNGGYVQKYIKVAVIENIELAALLGFVADSYPLPLPLELILVPFLALCACLVVVANNSDEGENAASCLNGLSALVGLGLLAYGIHSMINDFSSFASVGTLSKFLFPIVLGVAYIPVIAAFFLFVEYQNIDTSLKTHCVNTGLVRHRKMLLLVRRFGIHGDKLNSFRRSECFFNFRFAGDIAEAHKVLNGWEKDDKPRAGY